MSTRPTVLVLGSGAREHALARALRARADVTVAPGNDGMAADATLAPLDPNDAEAVLTLARDTAPGLIVVGPEEPLVNGVADALRADGFTVLGPGREAARLEGSKTFMKQVATAANVPTAAHAAFGDEAAALAHLARVGAPVVVKADGLAAGKGVSVCEDAAAAEDAIHACFSGRFGAAGARVMLEERLEGPEISAFVLCDRTGTMRYLGDAQDHKRLEDGDRGPNTGGMGAFSPSPLMDDARREEVLDLFVRPTLAELHARGTPFEGILFCGLMLTADGLKLLEYNVRLGDPEAQVVLPRLGDGLYDLLLAAAEGRLAGADEIEPSPNATCAVVLASPGYPDAARKGDVIGGLDADGRLPECDVVHAATRRDGGRWIADGGRVLSVIGRAPDVAGAREAAYRGVAALDWPDAQWRRDIAASKEG